MSDQDRIQRILAEYQEAIDAAEAATQAADAAEAERQALIDANPDVAKELEKHFSDGQTRDIDATVAFGKPESDTASHRPADPEATIAREQAPATSSDVPRFGDYELLEEVAKGGMGVVYKARQIGLDRVVALKMIRSGELADASEVERFHTEARAAAKLEHSGILPVHEIGERDGQHFFTMVYVEGGSLQDMVGDGPLPPRKAAELVRQAAEAMHHAHENGIVHRDLKPANILVDRDGQPKVADFGLAKRLEEDSGLTASGTAMGTPSYMPPEQALGKGDEIGPLADVYSLGAVLYCLLTGRPPFAADNYLETIKQVIEQDPVPLRALNPAIPRDLETICLKCLRKEQMSRFQSARGLAEDLKRWLENEPIVARRVGVAEKVWLWCKRRPAIASLLLLLAAGVVVAVLVIQWRQNVTYAAAQVESLSSAETARVNSILENLTGYRRWAKKPLLTTFENAPDESNAKLHVALALLEEDESVLGFLRDRLLTVAPFQFKHVRDALVGQRSKVLDFYWSTALDQGAVPDRRFRAACAVATFDSSNEHWFDDDFRAFVSVRLASLGPSDFRPFRIALRPVGEQLTPSLTAIHRNATEGETVRLFATEAVADFLSNDPDQLFDLLIDAEAKHFPLIFQKLTAHRSRAVELGTQLLSQPLQGGEANKEVLARRQANSAVMLLRMGATGEVWPSLKHTPDPRVRSYLVHWLSRRGVQAHVLIDRVKREEDVTIKRTLVLALGEFSTVQLPESLRESLTPRLLEMYRTHEDPGLRGAAEWLLRKWGFAKRIATTDQSLRQSQEEAKTVQLHKKWYVNRRGQTFVVISSGDFRMGSAKTESGRNPEEVRHKRSISRSFAISTKEVTKAEWRDFTKSRPEVRWSPDEDDLLPFLKTEDSPMSAMTWFEAAWYCNWLSSQEGIPQSQWCYEPHPDKGYGPGMRFKDDFLALTGYRLPTEAEWEFACRSGTTTARYYGQSDELLHHYGWYASNSGNQASPTGMLKPNDFGLFDIHGNVFEWCLSAYKPYSSGAEKSFPDGPVATIVTTNEQRLVRGGGFQFAATGIRSAARFPQPVDERHSAVGFRIARTYELPGVEGRSH